MEFGCHIGQGVFERGNGELDEGICSAAPVLERAGHRNSMDHRVEVVEDLVGPPEESPI
jgi:hypothetical protein